MRYSTDVFLPEPKKKSTTIATKVENISLSDIPTTKKKLPEREIIRPEKEVHREIISPEH